MPTRTRALRAFAFLAAAVTLTGCGTVTAEENDASDSFTVTDDQGREVTIMGPVERAVVINSYGNEVVRAIGAGETVVGVDRTSIDRLAYLDLDADAVVAEGLDQLNYEAISRLQPDVVVLPRNAVWQEAATQLEGFGIPVVVATAWDYDVADETVELLGEVFGAEEGAQELLDFGAEIQALLADRLAEVEPVSVYFETEEPYLTALPGSGFHAMIEAAGGRNVFEDAIGGDSESALTIDPVEVVTRNPEVILHEQPPVYTPTDSFLAVAEGIAARPGFSSIPAVQEGRIHVTNGWALSANAKSLGALFLATWLHPEAMEGVDAEVYLERWTSEFQGAEFLGSDAYFSAPLAR